MQAKQLHHRKYIRSVASSVVAHATTSTRILRAMQTPLQLIGLTDKSRAHSAPPEDPLR